MPWMKLMVPIEQSQEIQQVLSSRLMRLFRGAQSEHYVSAAALYRQDEGSTSTFYLSPAAATLAAGKFEFPFAISPRPSLNGDNLILGDTAAGNLDWVELTDEQRRPEPVDPVLAAGQAAEWEGLHGDDEVDPA
jgi:hypothetical protein